MKLTDEDAAQEVRGNAVNIARQLQRPKRFDDDDDDATPDGVDNFDAENEDAGIRRQTIFKLHENRDKQQHDYSDLPRNFERRFLSDGKTYCSSTRILFSSHEFNCALC